MPELPEVEVTCLGIKKLVVSHIITALTIRQPQLRWRIPETLYACVQATILSVKRHAKYILIGTSKGTIIIHLGMTGTLRVLEHSSSPTKHDHVDFTLGDMMLRYRDPRRFGAILWCTDDPLQHRLLSHLGKEPLTQAFNGAYLYSLAKKKSPVKQLIMDQRIVVGIGNIYANEALFMAGIRPTRAANRISLKRYQQLSIKIKEILQQAIQCGGTTLNDFRNSAGKPGYFQQQLRIYGNTKQCPTCQHQVVRTVLSGRSTFYCQHCQH